MVLQQELEQLQLLRHRSMVLQQELELSNRKLVVRRSKAEELVHSKALELVRSMALELVHSRAQAEGSTEALGHSTEALERSTEALEHSSFDVHEVWRANQRAYGHHNEELARSKPVPVRSKLALVHSNGCVTSALPKGRHRSLARQRCHRIRVTSVWTASRHRSDRLLPCCLTWQETHPRRVRMRQSR